MTDKPNLDVLRSFAVLLVLFDHLMLSLRVEQVGRWSPGWMGVFGVYLFFVHTCLVLMWSLDRKPHILDFYLRRAFRIYPLAMLAVVLALLFRTRHYVLGSFEPSWSSVVANLLLVQNIVRRGGYALGVLWSLPLEVDMYVLLPVLYFFVRKNRTLWPLLLIWALACGLARTAATGNIFPTVIPCFLPGVMAYVLFSQRKPVLPGWLLLPFLLALMAAFLHFDSVIASWPACLALGLGLPFFQQVRSPWLRRGAHLLAMYSYGIYLMHPFAIAIAFSMVPHLAMPLRAVLTVVLTGVFAVLAYHLIEHPLIERGKRVAARVELHYERKEACRA